MVMKIYLSSNRYLIMFFFLTGSGAVGHGEEQNYIFNRWYSADIPDNSDFSKFPESDVTVHYRFMSLFTNFIKEL